MNTLKNLFKKIPQNVLTTILLLTVGAVLLGVFYIPKKVEEHQLNQFARPLFYHLLPDDTYAVQVSSVRDNNGGTTAAIILGTSLTQEELLAFYSDTEYPPAKEGESVDLEVKPLDDVSIDVLKKAGKYRDQSEYYFVYIYSSK